MAQIALFAHPYTPILNVPDERIDPTPFDNLVLRDLSTDHWSEGEFLVPAQLGVFRPNYEAPLMFDLCKCLLRQAKG